MPPKSLTDGEQKLMELLADASADRAIEKINIPGIIAAALALHQATCPTAIAFKQSKDKLSGAVKVLAVLSGVIGASGIAQLLIWLIPKL